jgi:glutamine synthetase
MVLMADRYILLAGLEYQRRIADSVSAVKAAGSASKEGKKLLDRLVKTVDQFRAQTESPPEALDHSSASTEKHARHMRDTVVPAMATLRELGDQIELMVPHELWPLPTYREMLFIK